MNKTALNFGLYSLEEELPKLAGSVYSRKLKR
jgi:hypothetical protein